MTAVLGVDLGEVRIGLALCPSIDLPALPLESIPHASREADARRVADIAAQRGATVIVVGYPLTLRGARGAATHKVDGFVKALRAAFSGSVDTADERMTTGLAAHRLRDLGGSGSKRRSHVDAVAAAEILEGWRARKRRTQ